MGDEITALFTDNPDTVGLAIAAFVRLSPDAIPRVDILRMRVDLGF